MSFSAATPSSADRTASVPTAPDVAFSGNCQRGVVNCSKRITFALRNGKPVARRGRKATGLFREAAGLPNRGKNALL
jgi:hypothetical protein